MEKLALIGFMGSGKTTVGKEVGKALGWQVVDCDKMIELACGCTINHLFATKGEAYFREVEHRVIKQLTLSPGKLIIATGGGVVENSANMSCLSQSSTVIWLKVGLEEILRRLAQAQDRPLLRQPQRSLEKLFLRREKIYQRYADMVVDACRPLELVKAEVVQYVSSNY